MYVLFFGVTFIYQKESLNAIHAVVTYTTRHCLQTLTLDVKAVPTVGHRIRRRGSKIALHIYQYKIELKTVNDIPCK